MKWLIAFLLLMTTVQAQDVNEAYQREIKFLEEQRQSLQQWKVKIKQAGEARRQQGEQELAQLNGQLASLNVKNQVEQENVQRWEKLLKDAASSGPQLEKNLVRMEDALRDLHQKIPLSAMTPVAQGTASVEAFRVRLNDVLKTLQELRSPALRSHAFLDEQGRLVKGEIFSLGLFGAFGVQGSEAYTLAPYDRQWLQAAEKLADNQVLLFDPSFQKAGLKTHAGWKEQVADAAPALIMLLIMLTVVALFVALARA